MSTANLILNIHDGTRQLIDSNLDLLITLRDGNQKEVFRDYRKGPPVQFELQVANNLADYYTVIAWAKSYQQAGFTPIKISPQLDQTVDLMLLPKKGVFDFDGADWNSLSASHPQLIALLTSGSTNPNEAKNRYQQLMEVQPAALAAFFNITTAMHDIHLPNGTPLDYLKELVWDGKSIKPDRFFAYANKDLLNQVKLATEHGVFAPEPGAGILHPGATSSYKEIQFGEANVQLTFHENDTKKIGEIEYVKVEPDIDYYKDPLAHALLEVIPNNFAGVTNPKVVYVLRWMAGRRAGLPEFSPPYTIG